MQIEKISLDREPLEAANKANVRFINSKETYATEFKRVNENLFRLSFKGASRDFYVRSYTSTTPDEVVYSLHFLDSQPYDPKNPGSADGLKFKGSSSLEDCMAELEKQYRVDN